MHWEKLNTKSWGTAAPHSMLYEIVKQRNHFEVRAQTVQSSTFIGSFASLGEAKAAAHGYQKAVRVSKNRPLTPAHG
jgi:hypothetical protein